MSNNQIRTRAHSYLERLDRTPDLSKPISGCPFAPRCEFAQEKCVTSTIALKEIADGHFSACLRIQLKEIDLTPAHLPEKALARKLNC